MRSAEFAAAKVNLYLHVGPLGADGYHPLESWMAFADVGDTVSIEEAATESFAVAGPFAKSVPTDASNLVLKARHALGAQVPTPLRLLLEKRLPPASGIGGGSSDAAAVLRLLRPFAPDVDLPALALTLGADVPACLHARSILARGRGQVLSSAPTAPPLPVVLVNPGVAVSTGAIFGLYDRNSPQALTPAPLAGAFATPADVAEGLALTRNDLQAPAIALEPVIGEVLGLLAAQAETLLARMSGSGATCFALCKDRDAAAALAAKVSGDNPQWWVKACNLT